MTRVLFELEVPARATFNHFSQSFLETYQKAVRAVVWGRRSRLNSRLTVVPLVRSESPEMDREAGVLGLLLDSALMVMILLVLEGPGMGGEGGAFSLFDAPLCPATGLARRGRAPLRFVRAMAAGDDVIDAVGCLWGSVCFSVCDYDTCILESQMCGTLITIADIRHAIRSLIVICAVELLKLKYDRPTDIWISIPRKDHAYCQ